MAKEDFLDALRAIVGLSQVLQGPETAPYETEWRGRLKGSALAVVRPQTVTEVQDVVRLCGQHGTAIVPQGGNTGLCAGAMPDSTGTELILSLGRLNGIQRLDRENMTVTVGAGVTLHALRQHLANAGFSFPLSLGSEGSCTLGGNLATNAGGAQALRYGNARDLCLGLEFVTASGAVVSDLGGLRKDNTGFDLRNLLIGSEGCLGIITAATLRIFDAPTANACAWLAIEDEPKAIRVLRRFQQAAGQELNSFELMNRPALELVRDVLGGERAPFLETPDAGCFVLVELAGTASQQALDHILEGVLEQTLTESDVLDAAIADSHQRRKSFWLLRENIVIAQAKVARVFNFDISLPISAIPSFLRDVEEALKSQFGRASYVNFGHLGDGNLHFSIHANGMIQTDDGYVQLETDMRKAVYLLVRKHQGSFSAEHGIGSIKVGDMSNLKDPEQIRLMQEIKHAFDPNRILNPGKVLPFSINI